VQSTIAQVIEEQKQSNTQSNTQNGARCHRACERMSENIGFSVLTSLLTVWALMSDDVRLITTNAPMDDWFDLVTCFCLLVFIIEVVISSFGKQDYFGGLFFFLDIVSTSTLILDLTFVSDEWFADDDNIYQMKNSKTARLAARSARIVRVLRLVRILKLYKAVQEAKQRRSAARRMTMKGEEKDWHADVDAIQYLKESFDAESNLGKKLSQVTTLRLIFLILAMLVGHPFLSPTGAVLPGSEELGADIVEQHFVAMEANSSRRWLYEEALLRYMYEHNWYSKNTNPKCSGSVICPADKDRHVFWVGISSRDATKCKDKADLARIRASSLQDWEQRVRTRLDGGVIPYYSYNSMPDLAQRTFTSPWDTSCPSKNGFVRLGFSLISEEIDGVVDYAVECPEDIRKIERNAVGASMVSLAKLEDWSFVFYFDDRPTVRSDAIFNLLTTIFIVVLLCGASMMFSHDAQILVLRPVEMMMLEVAIIRSNPLMAAKLTDQAFKREELMKQRSVRQSRTWHGRCMKLMTALLCTRTDQKKVPLETAILQKTIVKLGALMAIGFGGAGMNIVHHNMQGPVDSAEVSTMIPGTITTCIIAYISIGDFTTFTEVLQAGVMTFVNQVAEIIHGVADAHHGSPSATSGDTFVTVWNLDSFDDQTMIADMSILASTLMIVGVHTSPMIGEYSGHPGLQQRLGTGCRVSLSIGLHGGWAIEGALGTEYKFDATYVSPNVSITASVSDACVLYGTAILMTEDLHSVLSKRMRTKCRLIDHVRIKGATHPMRLYTIDLHFRSLKFDRRPPVTKWNPQRRFRANQVLEGEKLEMLQDGTRSVYEFEHNSNIRTMRRPYTVAFHEIFGMGFQNYSEGEWKAAHRLLHRASGLLEFEDGPSSALLRYMQIDHFNVPEWWRGYHYLEEMPAPKTRASNCRSGRSDSDIERMFDEGRHEVAVEEPPKLVN